MSAIEDVRVYEDVIDNSVVTIIAFGYSRELKVILSRKCIDDIIDSSDDQSITVNVKETCRARDDGKKV